MDCPETGYDLDTFTDDICLFMDYLKINRAILVQHTNEGIELPRFAARLPERVLKLVFLEPPYDRNASGFKEMIAKWPNLSYPEDNGVFDKISDFVEHQRKTVTPYATSWCEARDEQLRHQLTINSEGKVVYKGTEGIWKAVREMRDSYTPDFDFVKITAPTLCIFPIRDNTYYIWPFMNQSEREQMVEFYETVQIPWYR